MAEDLDDLKNKLINYGNNFVKLIRVNAWDGSWSTEKQKIPVNDLSEADIAWLQKHEASTDRDGRCLECKFQSFNVIKQ